MSHLNVLQFYFWRWWHRFRLLSCTSTWTRGGHDAHQVTVHHMLGCINWALLMISYSQLLVRTERPGSFCSLQSHCPPPGFHKSCSLAAFPLQFFANWKRNLQVLFTCRCFHLMVWRAEVVNLYNCLEFTVVDSQDIILVKCCTLWLPLFSVKSGFCSFLFNYL